MRAGKFAVDTIVVISVLRGDAEVKRRISELQRVFLPVVTLGESHFGAPHFKKPAKNLAILQRLLPGWLWTILPAAAATAATYGKIRARLAVMATPSLDNDIWIAAAAMKR